MKKKVTTKKTANPSAKKTAKKITKKTRKPHRKKIIKKPIKKPTETIQQEINIEKELNVLLPESETMIKKMFHNRRLLIIKGTFMVLFGVIAFVFPELTLLVLLRYLAIMFVILWWFLLVGSFGHIHDNKHWFLRLIEWLLDIGMWVLIIFNPQITLQLVILLISVWAAMKAVMYVIHAIKIKKHISLFLFNALILLIFAFVLFFHPLEGVIAMTYLLWIFAIVFGIWVIFLWSKLRHLEHTNPVQK